MKPNELWTHYDVTLNFLTSLCASVPANPDLVRIWLESRAPAATPPRGRSIPEIQEEVLSTVLTADLEEPSKSLLVFQRINGKPVIRAATLRAHLKDCARQISVYYVGKIKGEKAFSTRVINCVYPDETQYWIPILRQDGSPVDGADGIKDKAVHTWSGNALKSIEFIEGARLDFHLKVLAGNVSQDDLATVLTYGGVHGYGGERGDGEGRYEYTIQPKENSHE